jgi:hypothetical protein
MAADPPAIGVASNFPFPGDIDDGSDWIANVNDDVLERFDGAADEFREYQKIRGEEARSVFLAPLLHLKSSL